MKNKSIQIITILMIISLWSYSQSQCFIYDAAGNRTSRAVCASRLLPDDQSNDAVSHKIASWSGYTETEVRSSYTHDLSQAVVYPNPSTGIFMLSGVKEGSDCTLMVLDGTGREMWTHKGVPDQIDLTHLPSGKYYFFMHGSGAIRSMQIIITK